MLLSPTSKHAFIRNKWLSLLKGFQHDHDRGGVDTLEGLQEQCDRWVSALFALALASSSLAEATMAQEGRVPCMQSTSIMWSTLSAILWYDLHVC